MKPVPNKEGYLGVQLRKDGATYTRKIHLLVAHAFKGVTPTGLTVNHEDGIKGNNRDSNLVFRTRSYQERHKHALGLANFKGANNNHSILSDSEMASIPVRKLRGERVVDIARSLGVSMSVVTYHARKV